MLGIHAMKPVLGPVAPATPAAFAGFEKGDTLRRIEGEPVETWQDARWLLLSHAVERPPSLAVEVTDIHGQTGRRTLDLSGIQADDLDAEFLKKNRPQQLSARG
jgi:regulator of sigma E protease